MLTADLVRARRRGDRLQLLRLQDAAYERALDLTGAYLGITERSVGQTRETFEAGCTAVAVEARYQRLSSGLLKLIKDRCQFEVEADVDAPALRREVFLAATKARRDLGVERCFDARAVLAPLAKQREVSVQKLERMLYADLRSAHRLIAFDAPTSAEALVEAYVQGQAQAVLLRATRVVVVVQCRSAGAFRQLFFRLKFLRLLFAVEQLDEGAYRIVIDGPYSLFTSVTKYGLQLALMLPALQHCDHFKLEADVLWGKQRQPLRFDLEGGSEQPDSGPKAKPLLPDEVRKLLRRWKGRDSPWKPRTCADVLQLPGIGLCVPDLLFEHTSDKKQRIYLEVLGYWSREAVWRRVDLVEAGLPHRILFAVSERLRVGEAALSDDSPGALYVFKGTLNAKAIEQKLEELAKR